MARVAVFDSGLGSLSVIGEIQRQTRCEIIYLADRRSFPYGSKTRRELEGLITGTIAMLRKRFSPDLIVVGSNTPSILLDIESDDVLTVLPPVREAWEKSVSKSIAVLATGAAVRGRALSGYIAAQGVPEDGVHGINCSELVELVESGDIEGKNTGRAIERILRRRFERNGIDVATLSSTHLPFLRTSLEERFPEVTFLDPASGVARKVGEKIRPAKRNTLMIYTTRRTAAFERNVRRLGIKSRIISL